MTDYTNLQLSIEGHTATLTLNNPPAHTWTMDRLQKRTPRWHCQRQVWNYCPVQAVRKTYLG
ncbi:hypothetical protein [Psychrobacter pocilloporae]|uniref:hypothetical protein n=1 Tax=Psychrobacter pocilloporae TaxID=1775882 RepID=UPI002548A92C|nr:hypothetical protein [Psychrobacter pocilloporae]